MPENPNQDNNLRRFQQRPGRLAGPWLIILAIAAGWGGYYLAQRISWLGGTKTNVEREFTTMHTYARLVIPASSGSDTPSERLADMAENAIREIDALMSPAGESSDVRRLNSSLPGAWVEVNPLTWRVVMESLRWHRLTGGAFDPTISPIKALFSFNQGELAQWPSAEELEKAKLAIGAKKLLFDREGMRLSWEQEGMKLDLGAIAKGFAVDRAAEILAAQGVKNALIDIGGEVRLLGEKPGSPPTPWRTGIKNPRGDDVLEIIETRNMAIATSGDYESFFTYQGKRYEHIIDPRTALPLANGVASVTVQHPTSCTAADALATSLSVLGPKDGASFVRSQAGGLFRNGVKVVMLYFDNNQTMKTFRLEVDKDGAYTESEE